LKTTKVAGTAHAFFLSDGTWDNRAIVSSVYKHMHCPRCGKATPQGAAFCMHCGQPVAAPPTTAWQPASTAATTLGGHGAKRLVAAVAVTLLAAAGIVLGLGAAGVLKLQGIWEKPSTLASEGFSERPSVLPVNSQGARPLLLPAEGQGGRPILPSGGEVKVMPADVRRWLEHLERIEKRRVSLTQTHLAGAMATMMTLQLGGSSAELDALLQGDLDGFDPGKTPPAIEKTEGDLSSMRREWATLTLDFNSLAPPRECVPIRNSYDQAVRETGGMILDILGALQRSSDDREGALKTLMGMKGKSDVRIGVPAGEADGLVEEICRKYDTRKWFNIARDIGGGGMMGRMGF
jgi:hypothetical protein